MNVDEAGQYWMALGQNHFTPFYSETKGLKEVISQNNFYNLDPGGFTYILHFWLMISKNYLWVKLLPMVFFILFVFFLVRLLPFFFNKNEYLSLLIIPILFISNALPFYGIFLRAYSMEYFGITLTLYFLFSIDNPKKFYFLAGIICAIFLWSRYGFAIHILALYILSLLKFNDSLDRKSVIKNSIYFGIPILFSMVLIYIVTLKYQFIKPTHNLSYLRYISDGDLKKAFELICAQFSSFINLPVFILILFILTIKILNLKHHFNFLKFSNLKLIIVYFGLYHIINFILSYLGLYPYSPRSYNSKQFELFNILSIYFLTAIFINHFSKVKIITFILIIAIGSYLAVNKRKLGRNNLLYALNKYNSQTGLFVSQCNYPTTRYLVEQKIFEPKFSFINIYQSNSIVKSENIIIYNESEHIYYGKMNFDSTYQILESLRGEKPSDNSEVYIKK